MAASEEPRDESWRWWSHAKCLGLDPNMFVPDGPGGSLDRALAVCHGRDGAAPCPVRMACYDAGEKGNESGIWGGQVRNQRGVRIVVPLNEIKDMRPKRT